MQDPDNPKLHIENWWSTSQKLMHEKDFLEQLLKFDKDNIPEEVMNRLRTEFLNDPEIKPSRVEKASFAARGLAEWLVKIDQYDRLMKFVKPK